MITRSYCLALGLILACSLADVRRSLGQENPPPRPHRQVAEPLRNSTFSEAFATYGLMPRWSQGYLTTWTRQSFPSDTTENVSVYDRLGKLVTKIRIALPDSSVTYLDNVVAGEGGRIAAVGWGVNGSGTMASFLADVSLSTRKVRIIQLSPFAGRDVTFGPDGTLWVAGSKEQFGPEDPGDGVIVEHFGADDTLSDSHILRSSLHCPEYPIGSFTVAEPAILASNDRIGLLLRACHTWIELDRSGALVGQWTWKKEPPDLHIYNFAFTTSNELYAKMDFSATNCLGYFDKKSGSWTPVDTGLVDARGLGFGTLLGSDDDKLVYRSGETELYWSKTLK